MDGLLPLALFTPGVPPSSLGQEHHFGACWRNRVVSWPSPSRAVKTPITLKIQMDLRRGIWHDLAGRQHWGSDALHHSLRPLLEERAYLCMALVQFWLVEPSALLGRQLQDWCCLPLWQIQLPKTSNQCQQHTALPHLSCHRPYVLLLDACNCTRKESGTGILGTHWARTTASLGSARHGHQFSVTPQSWGDCCCWPHSHSLLLQAPLTPH